LARERPPSEDDDDDEEEEEGEKALIRPWYVHPLKP
jgi:hypothetical protein